MNKCLFSVGLASVSWFGFVHAQDLEKFAPKPPPISPEKLALPKPPESVVETNSAVLVKKLKAIVCLSRQEDVKAGEVTAVEPIRLDGVLVPDQERFKRLLQGYLGKPLSLASIDALTRDIVRHYRAHDRPVMDVIVPEQDITTGVLQLVLLESRVGEVRAEGNRWFSSSLLASQVRLHPGDPISGRLVESDLTWLNGNPFRQVNMLYTPGKTAGTTDLVLQTKDRFPFRIYTGYENTGNASTGDDRWLAGFNYGNVFGIDHQFSYQFTTSSDFESLRAHSASYEIPLPWRHVVTLLGVYSETSSTLVSTGQAFDLGGHSYQASLKYRIPIKPIGQVTHSLFAGFDFKSTNNNLEFGGTQVFDNNTNIYQWFAGYEATGKDTWGSTSLNATVYYSPGNLDADNSTAVFEQARALAKSRYFYGRAGLDRINKLPGGFSFLARGSYQWADGNLLPSEQLEAGGYNTVRGYEESEARGDSGVLFSAELRAPSFSFARLASGISAKKEPSINDQFQLLGFWDYGLTQIHSPLPGEAKERSLSSAGLGLRYTLNTWLSLRFDYGWQLADPGLPRRSSSRAHLGVVLSY